jgi:hypothetical protein
MPKTIGKHQDIERSHERFSQWKITEKIHTDPERVEEQFKCEEKSKTHVKWRESFVESRREFFRGVKKLDDEKYREKLFEKHRSES